MVVHLGATAQPVHKSRTLTTLKQTLGLSLRQVKKIFFINNGDKSYVLQHFVNFRELYKLLGSLVRTIRQALIYSLMNKGMKTLKGIEWLVQDCWQRWCLARLLVSSLQIAPHEGQKRTVLPYASFKEYQRLVSPANSPYLYSLFASG